MRTDHISSRQLKKRMQTLLLADNFMAGLAEIRRLPARKAVGPLFSYLYSLDELVKWRAVTAMGNVVSDLAESDLESARVVMRQFIWNLNDESGGIGWGCPESMAEAMACNDKLAAEYGRILISYIRPDGNYLEHEGLQRGVLWGVGRLAHTWPEGMRAAAEFLLPYMSSGDPNLRGLAVWAVSPVLNADAIQRLQQLVDDQAGLMLFRSGQLVQYSVGQLAKEGLAMVERQVKG
ncbi:MAG: hypothetical protein PVH85_32515 [Desulfobacterales bacterium]|jgi:hypothetical protein